MDNIFVRVVQFPNSKVKGAVLRDAQGNYNIYLNSLLNHEQQMQAARHEIAHIKKGHFDASMPIRQAEEEAEEG